MNKAKKPPVPAAVYLVADNLDAVLAAAEDLLLLELNCEVDANATAPARVSVRELTDHVRTLEMTIAARTLQARARAFEVRLADQRYKPLIDLFIGGTAALQDAVAEFGDSTVADFHTGSDPVSYLRARDAIPSDSPGLPAFGGLKITESFLIAERIALGPLMDMCATFLDQLEIHYELYDRGELGMPDKAA